MDTKAIVDVVATVVEDESTALALPGGTTALALRDTVAGELAKDPIYVQQWQRFAADPRGQAPILAAVLNVVAQGNEAFSGKLANLLLTYERSQTTTTNITTGGAYIAGPVTVNGGDFVGRDKIATTVTTTTTHNTGADPVAIMREFAKIYPQIAAKPELSPQDKADVKSDVQDVEQELQKGEDADESFIRRRLRNIQRMAPDIWEVVLATVANPILGLGTVAGKIAGKMRDEADD